jgi:hypothetical protein
MKSEMAIQPARKYAIFVAVWGFLGIPVRPNNFSRQDAGNLVAKALILKELFLRRTEEILLSSRWNGVLKALTSGLVRCGET